MWGHVHSRHGLLSHEGMLGLAVHDHCVTPGSESEPKGPKGIEVCTIGKSAVQMTKG